MNETTNGQPLVSILMAVYNSEEFIQEAIISVLKQSYRNWELICINDGSTDKSLSILKEFEKEDSRILVIDQVHSGSASSARNAGLEISSGYFIAMLDSDDKIESSYLNKLVERYKETKADIVLSSTEFWDYKRDLIISKIFGLQGNISPIISGRESFLLSLDWKIGGIGICKSNLLKKVKYDTTGLNGDEYTTRLLFLKAESVAFCDARYYYRNNQNSTTKKFSVKYFEVFYTQYRLYQLIKCNSFEEPIVKFWKENLIKSLIADYGIYSSRKVQLSKNDRQKSLGLLKIHSHILHQEFLAPPRLDNRFKNLALAIILLHHSITFFFSKLWQTKKSIQALLSTKVESFRRNNFKNADS